MLVKGISYLKLSILSGFMTVDEKIEEIEEEISKTPYHKGTQHHIGKLKAKLAKLRDGVHKKGGGKKGFGYSIRKSGDATVVLVGFPSVGKSTLLNQLTNAKSKVAAYEFTTLEVVPGALKYRGAELQLLDVPGLVEGAAGGKGRGREVLAVIRNADLVLAVIDIREPDQFTKMYKELYAGNIRPNEAPPDITISKQAYGGVELTCSQKLEFDLEMIRDVLNEYGIHNARVHIRGKPTFEQLIDVVAGNREYIPLIAVLNKADLVSQVPNIRHSLAISAQEGMGIHELIEEMYKELRFIRIYMRHQGGKTDYEEPLIMREGARIRDVCDSIHRGFTARFRYANIWGPSAKHEGQKVGINHRLKDEDVLTLVLKK